MADYAMLLALVAVLVLGAGINPPSVAARLRRAARLRG